MYAIEFTKEFTSGPLTGIRVVERINTDFPDYWKVGNVGKDILTNDEYVITNSIIDYEL